MSDTLFEWGVPEENWFKMPLALVRALPIMETSAEIKVVFYVLRHTWGYGEFEASKLITSEEFENGRKRRNGTRIDNGTGLCANSVRDGIKLAVKHGLLAVVEDNSDKARQKRFYKLGNSALSAHKVAPQADPQRSTPSVRPADSAPQALHPDPQSLTHRPASFDPCTEIDRLDRSRKQDRNRLPTVADANHAPLPFDIPIEDELTETAASVQQLTVFARDLPTPSPSCAPTPPPHPGRKANPEPSAFAALRAAYEAALGHSEINWAQAGAGLKKLEKAGCTPADLSACYKWIKLDAYWAHSCVATQTIYSKLGEWRRITILQANPNLDQKKLNEQGYMPAGIGLTALEVYYESFSFADKYAHLDPRGEEDLLTQCTDLALLRQVCEAYRRTSYRHGNVGLILQWTKEGVPQHHANNNGSKPKSEKWFARTAEHYDATGGCTRAEIDEIARGVAAKQSQTPEQHAAAYQELMASIQRQHAELDANRSKNPPHGRVQVLPVPGSGLGLPR